MIEQIEVGNATDDKLQITLRGDATEIVKALVNGLPREALLALKEALDTELAARMERLTL